MRISSFRAPLLALSVLLLASCNHSDVTGPNADYVHVRVINDSSAAIWVPLTDHAPGTGELAPGAAAELTIVRPDISGGGFVVMAPLLTPLGEVSFQFVRPPAGKAGFAIATIHVTANSPSPVTAWCDRTDLVLVTRVTQGPAA